jgi:hypothetical protein
VPNAAQLFDSSFRAVMQQGGFVAKDVIFGHEAHDFFRVLVAEGVYEGVGG